MGVRIAFDGPTALRAGLLAALLALPACASFNPQPIESVAFKERSQTMERAGLTVTVAVPSTVEAQQIFGIDLAEKNIQPVWVKIRNDSDQDFWFMHHGVDPNYFSSREAAYKSHFSMRSSTNDRMDEHFGNYGMDPQVDAGGTSEGFVFSHLKMGTKEVRIRMFSRRNVQDFNFYVSVPGFRADWHEVDFDALWSEDEFVDLGSEQELYEVIEALPCCTMKEDGTGKGDPVNIAVIANNKDMGLQGFIRAGWDQTELLTRGSAWKTFKAFFGGTYKYSPMSSLYLFGRPQDVGLQKARDTIHERNHLRLWLSPWRIDGRNVWIGTITRDIGVYFTTRTWNMTTHAIDPDVDEARSYLTEDLATAQAITKIGLVPGVGAATPEDPHRNIMNAPWWTDGERDVYQMADGVSLLENLDYFSWELQ